MVLIGKPLWSGKNRGGTNVNIMYASNDREYPYRVIYFLGNHLYEYWVGKNGKYNGSSSRHIHDMDVMDLPTDLEKYVRETSAAEEKAPADAVRFAALDEVNKIVIKLGTSGQTAEGRGAKLCAERLIALLNGKKPPKIKKASVKKK